MTSLKTVNKSARQPRFTRLLTTIGALALASSAAVSLAQPMPAPQPGLPAGHPPTTVPGGGAVVPRQFPQRVPQQRMPVAAAQHAAPAHEEEAAHGGHHCPGHGPTDAPPRVNLYQGLLGVNNEKALNGTPLEKVLFRYENKDDECDPHNQPPPYFASLFNFAILAFLVGKFGRKPLAEALAKRRASIMTEIDNATRLKEQAERRLSEYEQHFETIDEKLETARAEYQAIAEQEKTRILEEARERQARMRRDAEFRIEQELKTARLALLHEAANGAVRAAEDLLKTRVSASDHDKLADDYLSAIANYGGSQTESASQASGVTS